MSNRNTRLCRFFQQGHCNRGKSCQFAHEAQPPNGNASVSNQRNGSLASYSVQDDQYRTWLLMIPKAVGTSRPMEFSRLSKFFKLGQTLVERDEGTRQEVITKLSSEGGLQRIKELQTSLETIDTSSEMAGSVWKECLLPFYITLSHPAVQDSFVLERSFGTIINFIFGNGGRRAIAFFTFTTGLLISLHPQTDEIPTASPVSQGMEAFFTIFSKTLELNGTAQVMEEFQEMISDLLTHFKESNIFSVPGSLRNYLVKIQRLLGVGEQVPELVPQKQLTTAKATFELEIDGPGWLSRHGIRHDNDHDDIKNISIMPTLSEIQSPRPEYLPSNDLSKLHLPGLEGLLDRQFRLLREDTIGQIRDAVRVELQQQKMQDGLLPKTQLTEQGARTFIYRGGTVQNVVVLKNAGIQIDYEFNQPDRCSTLSATQRKEWWERSRRLQIGSLVCLLNGGDPTFCSVSDRTVDKPSRPAEPASSSYLDALSADADRASVRLILLDIDDHGLLGLIQRLGTRQCQLGTLVEFPGVLLPAFAPTLEALKRMSEQGTMPFAEAIAPKSQVDAKVFNSSPPDYASKPGFMFDLKPVISDGESLMLSVRDQFDVTKLMQRSSLDEAQCRALVEGLTRSLALIQGPPGTGKSFTGVAIMKVLLENQKNAKLGPVICVCYTNHALDQLLEHLVEADVKQIIRIGSRSKSSVLEDLNLHKVTQRMDKTKTERHELGKLYKKLSQAEKSLGLLFSRLMKMNSQENLKNHLLEFEPERYNELFSLVDEDGFKRVVRHESDIIYDWLHPDMKETRMQDNPPRDIESLRNVNAYSMSLLERQITYNQWIEDARKIIEEQVIGNFDDYVSSREEFARVNQQVKLRVLQQANVIGVTTSGLARIIDLLGRVGSKVLLCEEAGEVLEAHLITALLPSVEHAILIGDHLQLRPQIQNYELSRENPGGRQYSLDVSLFERLVEPENSSGVKLPFSTLEIQRRMHPLVSQLIRTTLYPTLKDGPNVEHYPEVSGMRKRLFWFDHQIPEDGKDGDEHVSTSRTNHFEVNMVAGLVSHLVKQGTYRSEDIAVITPYLGQLQKLRRELSQFTEIVVGERDLEDLDAQGLEIEAEEAHQHQQPTARKTTLLKSLRIATVDNFQGEEAKVIVVSLVRSNDQNRCGFLRTSNRINVLLSRAQHGMYIIGNPRTSEHVPMWRDVLSLLHEHGNIGPELELVCPRHPDTPIKISQPDHFKTLSPEGGCHQHCVQRLSCGHGCPKKCHAQHLHDAVQCIEPCPRSRQDCDHSCPRQCGQPCPKKCKVMVPNNALPCGHIRDLECWEAQDTETALCRALIPRKMDGCNHEINVFCYQQMDDSMSCSSVCGCDLGCGHYCNKSCSICRPRDENGAIKEQNHGTCMQVCGRDYSTCNHRCQQTCHGSSPCRPCNSPCEVSCGHSRCPKKCHEPCAPCANETCLSSCPHVCCSMPCAAPCDWVPCSRRCTKILSCGHQCPSVCGEVCPDIRFCQICCDTDLKDKEVDLIMMLTYKDIDLDENPCIFPRCGHFRTIETMDGHLSMQVHYKLDNDGLPVGISNHSEPFSVKEMKSCPDCRGSLRDLSRYGRITRRALLDESTKKFITWANQQYVAMEERVHQVEREADSESIPVEFNQDLNLTVSLKGDSNTQMATLLAVDAYRKTFGKSLKLREKLVSYQRQVQIAEQPFKKVSNMVEHARRDRKTTGTFQFDSTVLQTRGFLLASTLIHRFDLAIFSKAVQIWKDMPKSPLNGGITVDFTSNRQECRKLIVESETSNHLAQQVECQILYARYAAIELSIGSNWVTIDTSWEEASQRSEALREDALEQLRLAKVVCDDSPSQCKGMSAEIDQVRTMLERQEFYTTVSTEERRQVLKAMAGAFASSTGHWYYCANRHPFTIGECGRPMQTARCPYCGAAIGGENHEPVDGVERASDLEEELRNMTVGD